MTTTMTQEEFIAWLLREIPGAAVKGDEIILPPLAECRRAWNAKHPDHPVPTGGRWEVES